MAKAKPRASKQVARPGDERVVTIEQELERWRAQAVPDPDSPLDADDVARLVRDCFHAVGVDAAVGESFSVNTVHYYRRKDILDEPEGRTSAARYSVRHVWQAAGARLAGFLGLVTLAEARDAIRGASETALRRFVAARVADARGRHASRHASRHAPASVARPLAVTSLASRTTDSAVAAMHAGAIEMPTAAVLPLGGDVICLIPSSHAALSSPAAARALVESLAAALGLDS